VIPAFLVAFLLAIIAAECTRILESPARVLVRWAVRLSYGRTPRALIRLAEETGNLRDCAGQFGKLGFALGLAGRGIAERVGRTARLTGPRARADGCEATVFGAAAEAMDMFFRDIELRVLPSGRRREAAGMIARLRELLRLDGFDETVSVRLLRVVTALADSLIADRNEAAALSLIADAQLHAAFLGNRHADVLGVRRAQASALCELGYYQQAQELLTDLISDMARICGPEDPRTFATRQAFAWAMAAQGRHREAETCLKGIQSSLLAAADAHAVQLRHVECKMSWVVGRQPGRAEESIARYDRVIADRARELAPDHPDCLDAEHSKGKLLVHIGDGPRAMAILEPLLVKRTRIQGARHSDTLETSKYLAVARVLSQPLDVGARRRAIRGLRLILRIQRERHGSQYPMTADTVFWLNALTEFPEGR
jgi:hypothetical protein